MAWVRSAGANQELVLASDSRLRPFAWDAAPKIIQLPRTDAVLAFAGETDYAYPIMLQLAHATSSWQKALHRGQTLDEYKGHLLRVVNAMLGEVTSPPSDGLESPNAYFLLAGYCWHSQRYKIWTLHYDQHIAKFTFRPAGGWGASRSNPFAVVGDEIEEAKRRLVNNLRSKSKLGNGKFDMEPFEVLMSMIADPSFASIGGFPQLVKVYRSLNTVPFVVEWKGKPSLFGRPMLEYEQANRYPRISADDHADRPSGSSAIRSIPKPAPKT
jgi:hypothetical protein